jgi:predicted GNAT family acetyltransferase
MRNMHALDRPVWSSLTTGWLALAQGDARAWRLDPDYGPFGAAADTDAASLDALAALAPDDGELWVVEKDAVPAPQGLKIKRGAVLDQMVAERITPARRTIDWTELSEADAEAMLALALATKPGPFAIRTHRLGTFIGVKKDGRLIAMAGERMRLDGFTEVSGVCTDPDFRGRGYAGALIRIVAERMLARGEIPFLHTYATNLGAIGLYESIGFRRRMPMVMTVLTRA